ncbi:MAG: agmatinase family protein [Planctomycetes bacterium]|nr:agmatinase family protein [Planctomycetota bacterium]
MKFDPNAAAALESGLFGLPDDPQGARVHILGVPFDATTSFRKGTARGPAAIRAASRQVDLFDSLNGRPYEAGIWMAPLDAKVVAWNDEASRVAEPVIAAGGVESGRGGADAKLRKAAERVDAIGVELNRWVEERTNESLDQGKLCGLVGGDHSTPFGAIQAHAARIPGLGILHVDAHADLRPAYEGFTWSHASILRNVAERIDGVARIVQVGVRDFSEEEHDFILASRGRIQTLFDLDWADARHSGHNLKALVRRTLASLPEAVYVTFDVDGLEPALCPNTGTPVPGGLGWNEAMLWLDELVRSGRRVVGFDLNEVAPAPGSTDGAGWDENVGARLLYRLLGFALRSQA